MVWKLAPSLDALLKETNRRFPDRDRKSDGTIGDTAHSTRRSDHNQARPSKYPPVYVKDGGMVHAVDIDDDPVSGCDVDDLVTAVVARKDPRVRYVIRNRRIIYGPHADGVKAGKVRAWVWHAYDGINAHKQHAHVSVGYSAAAENDVSPWWATSEQGEWDQMASKAELGEVFDARLKAYFGRIVGGGQISFERTIENTLRVGQENINETRQTRGEVAELRRLFEAFLLKQGGSENPTGDIS